MAYDTAYNYDPITPTTETRELYTNAGSTSFQLGLGARGFKGGTDLEIWDSAVAGTQLVEDTDYEIIDIDTRNSPNAGFDIYTRVRVLNPAYQSGNIYITYKVVLSYVDAVFTNDTRSLAESGAGTSIKYLTSADSPYTIIDGDGQGKYVCDSSGGNIDVILPTLADNQNRDIEIMHQVGGNIVNVDGEGAETIDSLTDIDLPEQFDRLKLLGTTTEWAITEERITAQLQLNGYAGYGSAPSNKIIKFTNVTENVGNLFSHNHGSYGTTGLEVTIKRAGKYSVNHTLQYSVSATVAGMSLNAGSLTTAINASPIGEVLGMDGGSNVAPQCGVTVTKRFNKNDVIRTHSNGNAVNNTYCLFTIAYEGN